MKILVLLITILLTCPTLADTGVSAKERLNQLEEGSASNAANSGPSAKDRLQALTGDAPITPEGALNTPVLPEGIKQGCTKAFATSRDRSRCMLIYKSRLSQIIAGNNSVPSSREDADQMCDSVNDVQVRFSLDVAIEVCKKYYSTRLKGTGRTDRLQALLGQEGSNGSVSSLDSLMQRQQQQEAAAALERKRQKDEADRLSRIKREKEEEDKRQQEQQEEAEWQQQQAENAARSAESLNQTLLWAAQSLGNSIQTYTNARQMNIDAHAQAEAQRAQQQAQINAQARNAQIAQNNQKTSNSSQSGSNNSGNNSNGGNSGASIISGSSYTGGGSGNNGGVSSQGSSSGNYSSGGTGGSSSRAAPPPYQCTDLTAGVTAKARTLSGPGHCDGEVTGFLTNTYGRTVTCNYRFWRPGRPIGGADGGQTDISPGGTVGGELQGMYVCGFGSPVSLQYNCFAPDDWGHGCGKLPN